MRFTSWPYEPLRVLSYALEAGPVSQTDTLVPTAVADALIRGHADVGLVPTLDVLLKPDLYDLVPGVGVVSEPWPYARLAVRAPLDQIEEVGFDPRDRQEALLAQTLLREHYGLRPSFRPADPASQSAAERYATHDALLLVGDDAQAVAQDVAGEGVVLDLGYEWLELTLRPMVWGLLAAPAGSLDIAEALALRDAARHAEQARSEAIARAGGANAGGTPDPASALRLAGVASFTLDGYALDGLEQWIQHLYFHGTLEEPPELRWIELPSEEGDEA
ncbi:MAG: MqnA/MqnD/SBP family protein [Bacteroidota bacterium]